VLYFNPGSCGPRRFHLPVTVGLLTIEADKEPKAEILPIWRDSFYLTVDSPLVRKRETPT